MIRYLRFLPVLTIILLMGVGIVMPHLTVVLLDHQIEKDMVQLDNISVKLMLAQDNDFFRMLEVFHGGYSQIEVSEGYRMTAEEAKAAAGEILPSLTASGRVYSEPEVTPVLFTSKDDPSLSAFFWCCVWQDLPDAAEMMWLEDQSGQMVAFQAKVITATLSAPNSPFAEAALRVAEFCRTRYPVGKAELSLAVDVHSYNDYVITLFQEDGDQERTYSLSLRLRDEWLYFNM